MLRLDLGSVCDAVVGVSVVLSFRFGVVSSAHNRFRFRFWCAFGAEHKHSLIMARLIKL